MNLPQSVALLSTILVVGLFSSAYSEIFYSSEIRFTEKAPSQLALVPASCPSSPHYGGDCSTGACPEGAIDVPGTGCVCSTTLSLPVNGQCPSPPPTCTERYYCSGSDVRFQGSDCSDVLVNTCSTSCSAGACTPPPTINPGGPPTGNPGGGTPPTGGSCAAQYYCSGNDLWYQGATCSTAFVSTCAYGCANGSCQTQSNFSSCVPNYFCSGSNLHYRNADCTSTQVSACAFGCSGGSCGAPPTTSATFDVRPALVRSGNRSVASWQATNATSCTVTENNPLVSDTWSGVSGEQTTSAISEQTIYTLTCQGVDGSTYVLEKTVNIIPIWVEQ